MPIKQFQFERKSVRLPGYDYTQAGAYFITILTQNRKCLLGHVNQGEMHLSHIGKIVQEVWLSIPLHFPQASIDCFVIMPNHVHGIICLEGAQHAVPLLKQEQFGKPVPGSIPTIIRSFKSEATRRANISRNTPGAKLWQRNYYEHVIRNEKEFQSFYDYILINPLNWLDDDEYIHSQIM